MALSSSARAALDKFKSQQLGNGDGDELDSDSDSLAPIHAERKDISQSASSILDLIPSGSDNELFRPEQPKTFEESGISYRVLESLILKAIKQEGPRNEGQLSDFLHISVNIFRDILQSLHKRELVDTPMPTAVS